MDPIVVAQQRNCKNSFIVNANQPTLAKIEEKYQEKNTAGRKITKNGW